MTRRIYKYALGPVAPMVQQTICMYEDAAIIKVGIQSGSLVVWAEVYDSLDIEESTFVVVGTGHPIEPTWEYVGTVFEDHFVWHVMEVPPRTPFPPKTT